MTISSKELCAELRPRESQPHYCNHLYCRHIATTSVWGWRGEELVLKGEWCWNHDTWWKRIEPPKVPKDVRNHLLTFLSLAGTVTFAINFFPIFLITLVVALGIMLLSAIYLMVWALFDSL